MKKYSMKDIAKLSNVSVATVSRVINKNGRFSEETKDKVLKVIKETGYQPNFSAKSLRMNRSLSIGILVPDITNYFFADVVQKIEEILFQEGYSTIICNTNRNNDKELVYLNTLRSKNVDGLIVISGAEEFDFSTPSNATKVIPYICIDRAPKKEEDTIFISSDHYEGAFLATEKLIESGSTLPIFIKHSDRTSTSQIERFKGFKDALNKYNIGFEQEKNILSVNLTDTADEMKLINFFNKHPQIDGCFSVNDNLAIRVIDTLKQMNLAVPKDVKVIGFDGVPHGANMSPSLSTIEQNTDDIANIAVLNLLKLIKNPKNTGEIIRVPVSLIQRESTQTS